MKKEVIIGSTLLLLVATPALAAPQKDRVRPEPRNDKAVLQVVDEVETTEEVEVTITPTATPTATPTITSTPEEKVERSRGKVRTVKSEETCDPEADWKNHGEYVSCVAKTHPGGEAVSAVARSEVGKKTQDATPSATPTPDEETPITSAASKLSLNPIENIQALFSRLGDLFKSLKNLV